MDFIPGTKPEANLAEPGLWFVFDNGRLLIKTRRGEQGLIIPAGRELEESGITLTRKQFIGSLGKRPCYAAAIEGDKTPPGGFALKPLLTLLTQLDEGLIWAAGRANQLIHWEQAHNYCGACGSRIEDKADEQAKICPQCGLVNYPRVTPAVIAAVMKNDQILLARNNQARVPYYSVLAGFVEPNETLEECVRREVKEEVGIVVENIRYFGSQPWPFPNSLMIGFTAEYAAGEIQIDSEELSDAGWFDKDSLPRIPPPLSIAGQLIEWFVKNRSGV
ncbi:MAG: NAD(+) diphosphatase [Desulfobacterales bacterium]|nr:NAD(+) diphosphatase [Desulfobacterales bacterium]